MSSIPETNEPNGHSSPNEATSLLHGKTAPVEGKKKVYDWNEDPWNRKHPNKYMRFFMNTAWYIFEILTHNIVNVLFFTVPAGIIVGELHLGPTVVFILNFLAIIPLAATLSFATEEIGDQVGSTLAGLLNASFGNAVELIVSIIALNKGEIRIVQSSMLGSILSNSLLVLGCCFVAGAMGDRKEQEFNGAAASTMASLMAVSCASLIIPATLYGALRNSKESSDDNILILSHGTSIILLGLYCLFLWFQLKSHSELFDEETAEDRADLRQLLLDEAVDKRIDHKTKEPEAQQSTKNGEASSAAAGGEGSSNDTSNDASKTTSKATSTATPKDTSEDTSEDPPQKPTARQLWSANVAARKEREKKDITLPPSVAMITLAIATVITAICAEYLVGSIEGIVATGKISKTFIGLVLIPIVGNAAEHVTAVVVAYQNKMDLAVTVAIGSSLQIALFVTPFMVIMGWILGQPMTLHFQLFETVVFFLSVLVVNYLIQDGKSNYLEGAMCLGTYVIIALAFYVYPDDAGGDALGGGL